MYGWREWDTMEVEQPIKSRALHFRTEATFSKKSERILYIQPQHISSLQWDFEKLFESVLVVALQQGPCEVSAGSFAEEISMTDKSQSVWGCKRFLSFLTEIFWVTMCVCWNYCLFASQLKGHKHIITEQASQRLGQMWMRWPIPENGYRWKFAPRETKKSKSFLSANHLPIVTIRHMSTLYLWFCFHKASSQPRFAEPYWIFSQFSFSLDSTNGYSDDSCGRRPRLGSRYNSCSRRPRYMALCLSFWKDTIV